MTNSNSEAPEGAHVWGHQPGTQRPSGDDATQPIGAAEQTGGQATSGSSARTDTATETTAPLYTDDIDTYAAAAPAGSSATKQSLTKKLPTIIAAAVGVAVLSAGGAAAVNAFTSDGTPAQSQRQDGPGGQGRHDGFRPNGQPPGGRNGQAPNGNDGQSGQNGQNNQNGQVGQAPDGAQGQTGTHGS